MGPTSARPGLAEERAALHRIAALAMDRGTPEAVFGGVAEQAARLLKADRGTVCRFEPDGTVSVAGAWMAAEARKGTREQPGGRVIKLNAGRSNRGATVGAPVRIDGRVWGLIRATRRAAFAPEAEPRLVQFAALAAPAIAAVEARERLRRMENVQAAVRRVTALVALGQRPHGVGDAVAAELTALLAADQVFVCRYERDTTLTVLAHRGSGLRPLPPGASVNHDGASVEGTVRRTARFARTEHHEDELAELAGTGGARAAIAWPIVVAGRLWGAISASWDRARPAPDTEQQIAEFAQLLSAAIANADANDELTASRSRLLSAADAARRKVVRDLHDGAQQRLVETVLTLKLAQRALRDAGADGAAAPLVDEALAYAEQGTTELRELSHGILPTVLSRNGLQAGVGALVERVSLPVQADVCAERFPADIEASAYFIIAEALTNVVKHARATRAEVTVMVESGIVHVRVRDDGIGGAGADGGGLAGLSDRTIAFGGELSIDSPAGGGTLLSATLPLPGSWCRITRSR
ncbi:GAF domain-containing protein [Solirubrobacter ginsenosidimutans]|uniref:histidine kinase n=1 Tax=Solirubrobacter ginsenosidimutans TaxID=490573 RepID=A0A9X3MQG8_9ACTN|nr:GAF domain-containing protein [Solirubrobacter ginsenosidimutans]MDA0159941.1 GAF domain-containing protein [Solirubrobacter ginsenosidimutans]